MNKLLAIDFESEAIQDRPAYPPKPVGVAIKFRDGEGLYLAWGHPTQNNCTFEYAKRKLQGYLENPGVELVFHNASFDCAILEEKFDLVVPWGRVHDTMVQAFLLDPFGELSLKPLAERHLAMPPTERDAVKDWLVAHGKSKGGKDWGKDISLAPGELVGTYAIGDVDRTLQLHDYFYAQITEAGMLEAYEREMQLMPHVMEMERRGVNLDGELLATDANCYFERMDDLDEKISAILGKQVDVDS